MQSAISHKVVIAWMTLLLQIEGEIMHTCIYFDVGEVVRPVRLIRFTLDICYQLLDEFSFSKQS